MPDALRQRGLLEDEYYAQLDYYLNEYRQYAPEDFIGFEDAIDALAATGEIDERIVVPTLAAGRLFDDHAVLSRLFTFLDPEEMTKDPVFDFNPDLSDWPNEHTATLTISCLIDRDGDPRQARIMRLPNGRRLFFRPDESTSIWSTLAMPKSMVIQTLLLEGAPVAETDNTRVIDDVIQSRNQQIADEWDEWSWGSTEPMPPDMGPGGRPRPGNGGGMDPVEMAGSGCSASGFGTGSLGGLFPLLVLGLLVLRRRRA
jgi:uncharacterized protein (TIGR03382 family)